MKKSIVISCAGKGSRLKRGMPKCLVKVDGKPIIQRQLEMLKNEEDIIIVIGYKYQEVLDYVTSLNYPNVSFAYNLDYEHTATGESFIIGSRAAKNDFVIALDGDLLVHPNDMENVLRVEEQFVCGENPSTEEPIYMEIDDEGKTINFNREKGDLEWSGLAGIYKKNIKNDKWFVCDIMEEIMPCKTIQIRAREIDTPKDFEEAERWIKNDYDNNMVIDNFFKKRFEMKSNYLISRYHLNGRDEYDYNFLKQFINSNSSILDLGCGTGILEEKLSATAKYILAIDKYKEFIDKAFKANNIEYLVKEITTIDIEKIFDLIIMFGVTLYLSDEELVLLLQKVKNLMDLDSTFVIKNQWGIEEEVIVNKYSEQLDSIYYAKYRKLQDIINLTNSLGFSCNIHDIYPQNFNNWTNTHEYALVLRKKQ